MAKGFHKRQSWLFFALIALLLFHVRLLSGQPIKVAAIMSKTGHAAASNVPTLNGLRYAVEELNQKGGLLGREIVLLEFDNRSTSLGSKMAALAAVKSNVVIVFGATWSEHSLAIAPVLQQAGIPMISPYSTNPQVTRVGDFIFRICYTDPFQGTILANFAYQDLKSKTVGVLVNVNSKYSEGLASFFIHRYKELGGRVLFTANYLENSSDFLPIINTIKAHNPDVVFLPGHQSVSSYILKQARESGIKQVFIGGDGWNDEMYSIVGNVIEGNYYSDHWHPQSSRTESIDFVEKYKKQSRKIDPGNALGEDCVFLFADAVKRAGSLDPVKIRDAIADTNHFEGVTGTIRFDKNGDPIKSAVILKFERKTSVYVKTINP